VVFSRSFGALPNSVGFIPVIFTFTSLLFTGLSPLFVSFTITSNGSVPWSNTSSLSPMNSVFTPSVPPMNGDFSVTAFVFSVPCSHPVMSIPAIIIAIIAVFWIFVF